MNIANYEKAEKLVTTKQMITDLENDICCRLNDDEYYLGTDLKNRIKGDIRTTLKKYQIELDKAIEEL